jgi:hypothetical protein
VESWGQGVDCETLLAFHCTHTGFVSQSVRAYMPFINESLSKSVEKHQRSEQGQKFQSKVRGQNKVRGLNKVTVEKVTKRQSLPSAFHIY